ncbi:MAG: hypothetical protein OEY78_10045 [Gammaproteobacteria bacterium]|nr:hypothetical protein [Gammaproteobacteria bacterium]
MEISSTSTGNFSRTVTPAKNSSDRHSYDDAQANNADNKALERAQERALEQRAVQEKLQQNKQDSQRRLDGRLISFGQQQDNISSQQKQASYNRSRVNDAYSSPRNEATYAREQSQRARDRQADPIDIVV